MRTWSGRLEQVVTIRRYVGTKNPATSKVTETHKDHAARAVIASYTDEQLNGTLIRQGDRKLLFAASRLPITPATATTLAGGQSQHDAVLVGGEELNVVNVQSYSMGPRVVFYEVQVRK